MSGISKAEAINHALATEEFITRAERAKRIADLANSQQVYLDESAFDNSAMDEGEDLSHGDDPVL